MKFLCYEKELERLSAKRQEQDGPKSRTGDHSSRQTEANSSAVMLDNEQQSPQERQQRENKTPSLQSLAGDLNLTAETRLELRDVRRF
ncbi:hypothetical protein AOLI_G00040150 [Acnodon oligacanthus]